MLPLDVELIPLPYYPSLRNLIQVGRTSSRTLAAMWRGLAQVDVVWAFGPHPFALALVAMARVRGRRAVLGIRQDTMNYFRSRLPSRRAIPLLGPLWLLDRAFKIFGRMTPVTVVGEGLARAYGAPRPGVLPMTVSLMRRTDVVGEPPKRSYSGRLRLLTVGRVEPEKNPALLVDALAELDRQDPGRYELTWVGTGRLVEPMRRRAAGHGLAEQVSFAGFVPFGPQLLQLYRESHLFVHVSLTEGLPQVLVEAAACGLPIVATDVGGVSTALEHGRAGLLVPPSDRDSLVRAVLRMVGDGALRDRCLARGLELASLWTLEAQAERVARFILGLS
ncbi:MAG: glycosyltransferase family 4 protein [Actinomycetota bacterium]|nr:glycosyltransferase family 4 protein [Actinomycetota bacterium]